MPSTCPSSAKLSNLQGVVVLAVDDRVERLGLTALDALALERGERLKQGSRNPLTTIRSETGTSCSFSASVPLAPTTIAFFPFTDRTRKGSSCAWRRTTSASASIGTFPSTAISGMCFSKSVPPDRSP